jgi:Ca2+-binding EF-hand superfamily protein
MTISLSSEQIEALKAEFDVIDQNGDGRITGAEISTLLRREAYNHLSDAQRQSILQAYAAVDADESGGIDFDEFLTLVTHQEDPRVAFRKAFDEYDVDGDGFLTAEDFKRVTELQGGELTTEQADAMIQMADSNKDGKVSFDEYYAILTSG